MGYLDMAKNAIRTNPHRMAKIKDPQTEIDIDPSRDHYPSDGNEINEKNEIGPVAAVTPQTRLEAYQTLFEQALADISKVYLPGTLEMVREDFPDLASKTQEVEIMINELWLKARAGESNLHAFQQAVDQWKTLHMRGIQFFSIIEGISFSK
jgi:hypothetical protein